MTAKMNDQKKDGDKEGAEAAGKVVHEALGETFACGAAFFDVRAPPGVQREVAGVIRDQSGESRSRSVTSEAETLAGGPWIR